MPTENAKLVLVIDDDDGVRELLSLLLVKEGYRVETASDGEEGLHKAESLRPDLLILDLLLPRYGGFELLRHLQGGELAKTPIIVITGRYTDTATADLIRQESNVVELMEKPIKTNAMVLAIARIFASRAAACEVLEG